MTTEKSPMGRADNEKKHNDKKKLIIDEENRVQVTVEYTKPKTTDIACI